MVLTNDDCEFINDVDKGLIYFIQFKVTKTIQDSNYTKTGHINARYNGSRASSPGFNIRSKIK